LDRHLSTIYCSTVAVVVTNNGYTGLVVLLSDEYVEIIFYQFVPSNIWSNFERNIASHMTNLILTVLQGFFLEQRHQFLPVFLFTLEHLH